MEVPVIGLALSATSVVIAFFCGVETMSLTMKGGKGKNLVLLLGLCALVALIAGSVISFRQGERENTTLTFGHSYIVQGRGGSEFGSPLFVYDVNDRRNLVVESKEYPPKGFSEERIGGGEIALAPLSF